MPPSERELLCELIRATTVMIEQQAELVAVLSEVADQNATIIQMLGEVPHGNDDLPSQYLSGKPAR